MDELDLPRMGPLFEHNAVFPARTNTGQPDALVSLLRCEDGVVLQLLGDAGVLGWVVPPTNPPPFLTDPPFAPCRVR